MPPSHQTKTIKTALRPENLDERSAVVVKKEKCAVFEFILRIYHVPGRFSLRLTRLCHVLTTSNTFPLISYHVHYHARCAHHVQCALTTFLLRPIRSHHVLTAFSLRPSGPYKYCTTRWVGYLSPHAKCRIVITSFRPGSSAFL